MGAGAAGATGCGAVPLFLATGADGVGASRFSSLELQLEIPKAANNESTRIVKAIRTGVHKGLADPIFFDFFISCLLKNPDYETTITENELISYRRRGFTTSMQAKGCQTMVSCQSGMIPE
jgi:hypothetical protein